MKSSEIIQAWKNVLSGRRPSPVIEFTRECPLRCPGCDGLELFRQGFATKETRSLEPA
ncbi:MAG: hypothetical protein WA672_09995 [Candidatus Angelobacter sp.]